MVHQLIAPSVFPASLLQQELLVQVHLQHYFMSCQWKRSGHAHAWAKKASCTQAASWPKTRVAVAVARCVYLLWRNLQNLLAMWPRSNRVPPGRRLGVNGCSFPMTRGRVPRHDVPVSDEWAVIHLIF